MEASNTIVERRGKKKEVEVVIYLLLQATRFALCCQGWSFRQLNADHPKPENHHPTYRSPFLDMYISFPFPVSPHQYKLSLSYQHEPTMNRELTAEKAYNSAISFHVHLGVI